MVRDLCIFPPILLFGCLSDTESMPSQFVFSSSATVYGQPESVPVTEESRLHVLNPYGRTKVSVLLVMIL